MYVIKSQIALLTLFGLIVALAAINRSAFAWLKGYFGLFTTLGTYYGEHSALGSVARISVTRFLPGLAACGAALGLISIAFRLEELLFLGAESEVSPTIGTLKRLILKTHRMTSSLILVG